MLRSSHLTVQALVPHLERLFALSAEKILSIEKTWNPSQGTPVFTVKGKYTSRGWTEWTQGFQFGSALLQFDATGEDRFLEIGRRKTVQLMATHVSHTGVHDHGFNNISTYGNLWRLMREGKIPFNERENDFYELALKVSGAIQAARWTDLPTRPVLSEASRSFNAFSLSSSGGEGRGRRGSNTRQDCVQWTDLPGPGGFIYSFNGPHSLFVDTIRSLRSLAVAHQLGHVLMGERDRKISLLQRLFDHAAATARYSIYYGEGRGTWDTRGRTAHESIFNLNDGSYRCPNTQQGYSPFTTWTRGLAWAILGFAEQLEFQDTLSEDDLRPSDFSPCHSSPVSVRKNLRTSDFGLRISAFGLLFLRAATATADFYLANTCADGIPMWDTGAPNLHRLGDYLSKPSDPYNPWVPVDSAAAVIAAQGLIRLGNYLAAKGDKNNGARYRQAGLTVAHTLFSQPYLSTNPNHQGLILHSVYHRPNGWDYIPPGQKVPNGESSMWGDYHALELAVLLLREARGENYLTFFDWQSRGGSLRQRK